MTASGPFTYNDFYRVKPNVYHYKNNYERVPFQRTKISFLTDMTTAASIQTTATTITTTATTTVKPNHLLYEFVQLVPFTYIHWFLIGLAVLLTLLLLIIFICYCHHFCRKSKKSSRNEDKQPLPKFYRYRKIKGTFHTHNIYEATTPVPFPSPKRPYPLNSKEYLNNQSLEHDRDTIDSPPIKHFNISRSNLSNQYSNTASDLLTEIKTRLNTRTSGTSIQTDRLCEIPIRCTNMHLNTESKHDSLLIDMN